MKKKQSQTQLFHLKHKLIMSWVWILALSTVMTASPISIVTSTPDLADLAKQIGGDRVQVVSLAKGTQDPHHIEPRPSMVAKVLSADVAIKMGMELDTWMDSILETAKNPKLSQGMPGLIDASVGVQKLEVPKGKIDGSMGDIHRFGNPHYLLNPENARIVSAQIANRLSALYPQYATYFKQKHQNYDQLLQTHIAKWRADLSTCKNQPMISYHVSVPYLSQAFGLTVVGAVEEKPGIPPSARYLTQLEEKIKKKGIKVMISEPWQDKQIQALLAKKTGIKPIIYAPLVGAMPGTSTYVAMMDYTVSAIKAACE